MQKLKSIPTYKMTHRRWDLFNKFQRRHKSSFLKTLSVKEGLKLTTYLYQFIAETIDRKSLKKLSLNKVNLLANVHSLFNKVKA